MNYDKGPQITVGMLKKYLSCISDDVRISVGVGSRIAPLHYLLEHDGELLLHPDSYMIDAPINNLKIVLSFNAKKQERKV